MQQQGGAPGIYLHRGLYLYNVICRQKWNFSNALINNHCHLNSEDFQSAAEVSAGASDDVAAGQSRILSRSQPVVTVSKTPHSQKNRFIQTAPTVSAQPHISRKLALHVYLHSARRSTRY